MRRDVPVMFPHLEILGEIPGASTNVCSGGMAVGDGDYAVRHADVPLPLAEVSPKDSIRVNNPNLELFELGLCT